MVLFSVSHYLPRLHQWIHSSLKYQSGVWGCISDFENNGVETFWWTMLVWNIVETGNKVNSDNSDTFQDLQLPWQTNPVLSAGWIPNMTACRSRRSGLKGLIFLLLFKITLWVQNLNYGRIFAIEEKKLLTFSKVCFIFFVPFLKISHLGHILVLLWVQ